MRTCIIRILLQECVRGGRMQCVSNVVGCYCRTSSDAKFRDCNKFRVWESIQIWHRSWIKANSESPLLCGVLLTQKIRLTCWKLVHFTFACILMINKEVGSLFREKSLQNRLNIQMWILQHLIREGAGVMFLELALVLCVGCCSLVSNIGCWSYLEHWDLSTVFCDNQR